MGFELRKSSNLGSEGTFLLAWLLQLGALLPPLRSEPARLSMSLLFLDLGFLTGREERDPLTALMSRCT